MIRIPSVEELKEIDPENITIEQVMKWFGLWRWHDRLTLWSLVRRGEFERVGPNRWRLK